MNIHAFREKRRNILCQLRIISLHPIYVRVILRDSQSNIPFLSRSPSQTWGFLAGFSRIETICPHFSSSFLLLLFLPSLLSLFLFFLFLFFFCYPGLSLLTLDGYPTQPQLSWFAGRFERELDYLTTILWPLAWDFELSTPPA